jgi:hypothetical protein
MGQRRDPAHDATRTDRDDRFSSTCPYIELEAASIRSAGPFDAVTRRLYRSHRLVYRLHGRDKTCA